MHCSTCFSVVHSVAEWEIVVFSTVQEMQANRPNAERSLVSADAANVDNLKHLSQIVAQIARIDRLPDRNSNEAMFTLKDAWD